MAQWNLVSSLQNDQSDLEVTSSLTVEQSYNCQAEHVSGSMQSVRFSLGEESGRGKCIHSV